MGDVVFVAVVIAFFVLASLYVRACAVIVGAEPAPDRADEAIDDIEVSG
jgi:hypothetical protein